MCEKEKYKYTSQQHPFLMKSLEAIARPTIVGHDEHGLSSEGFRFRSQTSRGEIYPASVEVVQPIWIVGPIENMHGDFAQFEQMME